MKYTGDNLAEILSNFCIDPEGVSVNFASQSVKLGSYNTKRLHLNEWIVFDDTKAVTFAYGKDEQDGVILSMLEDLVITEAKVASAIARAKGIENTKRLRRY